MPRRQRQDSASASDDDDDNESSTDVTSVDVSEAEEEKSEEEEKKKKKKKAKHESPAALQQKRIRQIIGSREAQLVQNMVSAAMPGVEGVRGNDENAYSALDIMNMKTYTFAMPAVPCPCNKCRGAVSDLRLVRMNNGTGRCAMFRAKRNDKGGLVVHTGCIGVPLPGHVPRSRAPPLPVDELNTIARIDGASREQPPELTQLAVTALATAPLLRGEHDVAGYDEAAVAVVQLFNVHVVEVLGRGRGPEYAVARKNEQGGFEYAFLDRQAMVNSYKHLRIGTIDWDKIDHAASYHMAGIVHDTADFVVQKLVSVPELWLRSPNRRRYTGVHFRPVPPAGLARVHGPDRDVEREDVLRASQPNDVFNTYTGFEYGWERVSRDAAAGGGQALREALKPLLPWFRVQVFSVCGGSLHMGKLVLQYAGHTIQRPHLKHQYCVFLYGEQGLGKGTVMRGLNAAYGSAHSVLLGQGTRDAFDTFNAPLENRVVVFLDEAAIKPDQASAFKTIVTEHVLSLRGMYQGTRIVRNYLNFWLASNHSDFLRAENNERRLLIVQAEPGRLLRCQPNESREQYKSRVCAVFDEANRVPRDEDMKRTLGVFLSLIRLDDHNVDHPPPVTLALARQKVSGMPAYDRYIYEILLAGRLLTAAEPAVVAPADAEDDDGNSGTAPAWPTGAVAVATLFGGYMALCDRLNVSQSKRKTQPDFTGHVRTMFKAPRGNSAPKAADPVGGSGRVKGIKFPSHEDCVKLFDERYPGIAELIAQQRKAAAGDDSNDAADKNDKVHNGGDFNDEELLDWLVSLTQKP